MNGIAGATGSITPWELWSARFDDDDEALAEYRLHVHQVRSQQDRHQTEQGFVDRVREMGGP
jgi:hypothetical protein